MKLRLAGLLFAAFFSSQSFAYSIDSVQLTVDASKFHFDIVLSGITPTAAQNGVLRIHSEGDAIASPDTEQIAVNFDTQTGAPIFEPHLVNTYDTPLFDRWQDGEIDSLSITANGAGSWRFTGTVLHGTQPYVAGDILRDVQFRAFDGSTINRHIRDIAITGGSTTYTVGGTTTGLTGTGLQLQNNGVDTLSIAADGNFVFAAALADLGAYAVSVSAQPTGQTCSVSNGSGSIAGANVTNVAISCVDDVILTYSVGGTTTGLTGSGLELQNNSADTLSIATDGGFVFATELNDLSAYAVSVFNQPTGQTCSVSNGSGTLAAANITNVAVDCVDDVVPPVIPEVPATPIPTLSEWALIMLFMLLGVVVITNRRRIF